ncbi:hypothetical protein KFZ76_13280 [Methylovulum psychrotolerans]|uniref:hypothetical protein n=1 Tax=Methylovulum psychrotolerans TaxID=1704499 RepID=UPI001BFEF440|nr:hypothetical protein [Methylovulum psychrotolerans]MBT9098675.1 hypothetical protein [Methylovulum psychrotolerans]
MNGLYRLKVGGLHFCVSLSFFLAIFYVLKNFWYPYPYFENSGGWQGIKIVAGIDVVLGPLLTLVVSDSRKSIRELLMDVGVIAVFQCLALLWGIYTLNNQRPVAVVFWENSFLTVPAQALTEQDYELKSLLAFSDARPPLIYVDKSYKSADLKKMLEVIAKENIPPHYQTWLYRPLKEHFDEIKSQKLNIDQIIAKYPDVKNQLLPIMQKHNISDIHAMLYFLLQSKYSNSVLVFDQNAQYLGYVNPE